MTYQEFLDFYHDQVYSGVWTLDEALKSLRQAYKDYPDHRDRITKMAKVVKLGLDKASGALNSGATPDQIRDILSR